MKEILKSTISVLLAALIIFGCWIGIRALEAHYKFDLATKIINVSPRVYATDGIEIDELGRITLTVQAFQDFEYALLNITLHYDTYFDLPIGNGQTTPRKYENILVPIENLYPGDPRYIKEQLTLKQLEHLEYIEYEIVRCKLK